MSDINSTDLLKTMRELSEVEGRNIDIQHLATSLNMSIPSLISVITELENRDEIVVNIITTYDAISGAPVYTGTVRLMERPPDEAAAAD